MSHSVLVVNGDVDTREILRACLQHYGYQVWSVLDGDAALETMRERPPTLVITELYVTTSDGSLLTAAIRRDAELRSTRVLIVTTQALERNVREAREAGADGFLTKPLELAVLVQEIRRLIGYAPALPRPTDGVDLRLGGAI